jgi:hypothetical protein
MNALIAQKEKGENRIAKSTAIAVIKNWPTDWK